MAPAREPFLLCSGSFPEAFGVAPAKVLLLYQEYHWKTGECGFAPCFLVFYLWLLHRGLQGRSAKDKSKMKKSRRFPPLTTGLLE